MADLYDQKKEDPNEFGKVIDTLHKQSKLPTLRTYQGDTAEYVKNQNVSAISIATQEKKREEMRAEMEQKIQDRAEGPAPRSQGSSFKINITLTIVILVLLGGGGVASYYIYNAFTKPSVVPVQTTNEIIPYNNIVSLSEVTSANLESKIEAIEPQSGVTIIKISGIDGKPVAKSADLIKILNSTPVNLPGALERTLSGSYAFGILSQAGSRKTFLAFKVNDYGIAFSSMLDWEKSLQDDLAILGNSDIDLSGFAWKDLIVKNKDVRALVNSLNEAALAYTFLDKNTVLIVGDTASISDLSMMYSSRAVAR